MKSKYKKFIVIQVLFIILVSCLTVYAGTQCKFVSFGELENLRSEVTDIKSAIGNNTNNLKTLESEVRDQQEKLNQLNSVEVTSEELKEQTILELQEANIVNVLEAKSLMLSALECIPEDNYEDTSYDEFNDFVTGLCVSQLVGKVPSEAAGKVIKHLLTDSHDNILSDGLAIENVVKDAGVGVSNEVKSLLHSKTQTYEDIADTIVNDDTTNTDDYLTHLNVEAAKTTLLKLQDLLEADSIDQQSYKDMMELFNIYSKQAGINTVNTANKLDVLYNEYCSNVAQLNLLSQ